MADENESWGSWIGRGVANAPSAVGNGIVDGGKWYLNSAGRGAKAITDPIYSTLDFQVRNLNDVIDMTGLGGVIESQEQFGRDVAKGFFEANNPEAWDRLNPSEQARVQDLSAAAAATPRPLSPAEEMVARQRRMNLEARKDADMTPFITPIPGADREALEARKDKDMDPFITAAPVPTPAEVAAAAVAGLPSAAPIPTAPSLPVGPTTPEAMQAGIGGFGDILKGVRGDDPYSKIEAHYNAQIKEEAPSSKFDWNDLARFGAAWGSKGGTAGDALLALHDYKDKKAQQHKDNHLAALRGLTEVGTARAATRMADFQTAASLYNTAITNQRQAGVDAHNAWKDQAALTSEANKAITDRATKLEDRAYEEQSTLAREGREDERLMKRNELQTAADLEKAKTLAEINNKAALEKATALAALKGTNKAVMGLSDKDQKIFSDELDADTKEYQKSKEYILALQADREKALRDLAEWKQQRSDILMNSPRWQARLASGGGTSSGVVSSDEVPDED